MALIQCPECSGEISSDVFKCPKCGKVLRKPKRGIFGKIVKLFFVLFNILMLVWLIAGMNAASEVVTTAASEAERAGAAVGTGLGAIMIIGIWVAGDIILGLFVLFTRPKA